jgi:hypothetical protein
MDRLREQHADVAILPNFLSPAGIELIQENANRRSRSVGKCANKSWCRFIVANEFRDTRGTFTGELHGESLAGVLGESLLDLEGRFETIASGVDRPSFRAKDQRGLGVVSGHILVGKRFKRASERAILEAEPCAAGSHVELIVERIGLTQAECFLLTVKHFMHDQAHASEAIARQRKRDHRPRSSSPLKRRIRDVLIFRQRRYVRIAESQKMFPGDRVIRDDEARLPVDQGNGSAETPSPERASVRLTRRPGVAKGRERPCRIYLLSADK